MNAPACRQVVFTESIREFTALLAPNLVCFCRAVLRRESNIAVLRKRFLDEICFLSKS
jgi:hypothetical protein